MALRARSIAIALVASLVSLVGCRAPGSELRGDLEAGRRAGVVVPEVPFVAQARHDDCGAVAATILLRFSGVEADLDDLTRTLVRSDVGTYTSDLVRELAKAELIVHERVHATGRDLLAALRSGVPVTLLVALPPPDEEKLHYVVVTGFDADHDAFLVHDGRNADVVVDRAELLERWSAGQGWLLVAHPRLVVRSRLSVGDERDSS